MGVTFTDRQQVILQRLRAGPPATREIWPLRSDLPVDADEGLALFLGPCLRAELPLRHVCNLPALNIAGPIGEILATLRQHVSDGGIGVMIGPSGVGKTQIATAVAAQMIFAGLQLPPHRRRPQPRYTTANAMFRDLLAAFSHAGSQTERDIFACFARPDLLIIDELHELKLSDYESRRLTELIDARYYGRRATLLIANATRRDLGIQLGPSVVSRIQECGVIVDCNEWPSRRVSK